jgi:hypothetical protein
MFSLFKSIGHGFVGALIALHIVAAPVPPAIHAPVTVTHAQVPQTQQPSPISAPHAKQQTVSVSNQTSSQSPEKQREGLVVMKTAFNEMIHHLDSTSPSAQEHAVLTKLYMHQPISSSDTAGLSQGFLSLIQDPTFSGNSFAIDYYTKIVVNQGIDLHNSAVKFTEQKLCDTNPDLSESNVSYCHSLFADDIE